MRVRGQKGINVFSGHCCSTQSAFSSGEPFKIIFYLLLSITDKPPAKLQIYEIEQTVETGACLV